MAKLHSLSNQFKHAISNQTVYGTSKHEYKHDIPKSEQNIVHSGTYNQKLIELTNNFSNFMKENYPGVRRVNDIKSDHVQEFINSKSKNGTINKNTAETYVSQFQIINRITNKQFNFHAKYSKNIEIPSYIRTDEFRYHKTMSSEHVELLRDHFSNNSRSIAADGILIAIDHGLRVSEIRQLMGKDIDLKNGTLHIHRSKGGLSRDIPLKNLEFMKEMKDKYNNDEKIAPTSSRNITQSIQRVFDKNNITEYKEAKTSVHAIRKAYADREYAILRENLDQKSAENKLCEYLGHGKNREDVLDKYLSSRY